MKTFGKFIVCGIASGLAALIKAAPPPVLDKTQAFNSSVPLDQPSSDATNDTVFALGYDPSTEWQKWATAEVWTGGSKRQPVNVGNVFGHALHVEIATTLDRICGSKYGKYCENTRWQSFNTHYVERPPAGVKPVLTWYRTTSAEWANAEVRSILINIVARTLAAYTLMPLGTNCYEVPGHGRYCNVPQLVRVHLPNTSPDEPGRANNWFLELSGEPSKFSHYGNLKPCATRAAVDAEIDRYRGALEGQFPEWRGRFKRETRVIINGYKSCTDEP